MGGDGFGSVRSLRIAPGPEGETPGAFSKVKIFRKTHYHIAEFRVAVWGDGLEMALRQRANVELSNGCAYYIWIVCCHCDAPDLRSRRAQCVVYLGICWGVCAGFRLRLSSGSVAFWACRSNLDFGCRAPLVEKWKRVVLRARAPLPTALPGRLFVQNRRQAGKRIFRKTRYHVLGSTFLRCRARDCHRMAETAF